MILVDKPYISDFFRRTVADNGFQVVNTRVARELGFKDSPNLIGEKEAIRALSVEAAPLIYTTSENALAWIFTHLSHAELPEKISLFKDKVRFRRLIQPILPDFAFNEVRWDELDNLHVPELATPFIIKPSVGFFSMGVRKVTSLAAWDEVKTSIKNEIRSLEGIYPREVLNATSFIMEEVVEGEEFAVDAYFDATGAPVIVGLYHHLFGSGDDVSDRVYYTSRRVIEANLREMTEFLRKVGELSGARRFPIHAEIRRTANGTLVPIEINPMRFGGWCTTPDMTFFAYGVNPYVLFLRQEKPDWDRILSGKDGKRYGIIVMENATGIEGEKIAGFDYEGFVSHFKRPITLRKIDYRTYPVFCFLFVETSPSSFEEFEWALEADPREFVIEKHD